MSRNATLAQLLDDIEAQADLLGTDVRHTPARKMRLVNQAIQRFRELLTVHGVRLYLTPSSGTLTAGVESPYAFRTLSLSGISLLVRPYGLDITVSSVVRSLYSVPFQARNDYGGGNSTGIPEAWSQYNRNSLAILPAPDAAYPYTLWYIPRLEDMDALSDTFDGVAGWEDYIVWDIVCRLLARDQTAQAYQIASSERAQVWADIMKTAPRANRGGPSAIGRDTFGQKHAGNRRSRMLPPA